MEAMHEESETHRSRARSYAEGASIERRLRFAGWSQTWVRTAFHRAGLGRLAPRLGVTCSSAISLLYDLTEWPRCGFRLSHPGQVPIAALKAPFRLPQTPRHRGYWYDPQRHALVGMHLGLDLIPNQGKYYLIETNLGAALRTERRALYRSELDPLILELLAAAKQHDFKRIVLFRPRWPKYYLDEFALAQRESGIEVIGASLPTVQPDAPHPMMALPVDLQEQSIYVIFSGQHSPLSLFIHDKHWSSRWLQEKIAAHPDEAKLLTAIPTHQKLMLPAQPQDPRWPNLVIKLASGDQGKFVLMGRFRSEAHAREELRLSGPDDIPGVFDLSFREKMLDRFFPWLQAIYQPYIPPQLIDGTLRKARLQLFVSPLFDRFLSAHDVVTGQELPKRAPEGLIKDANPYNQSFSSYGGRFERFEDEVEDELRQVAREFGRIANLAIREKFVTTSE